MKRKGLIASVVIIVVIGGATLVGYRFINGPAQGSVVVTAVKKTSPPQWITTNSIYASFSRPETFALSATDKPVAPVVDAYSYVRHTNNTWLLNVQFTRLANSTLDDNSSYNYRNKTPDRYTKATQTVQGQPVVIFTDRSVPSYAKTAYLQHGNLSATISLMGGSNDEGQTLQKVFDRTIASLQWK